MLTGLRVARQHDAIRRVEALDERAARLPERAGQLAVHPDLGVVVHDDLEHHRRAARRQPADRFGDRQVEAIPREADLAAGAALFQARRVDCRPPRIVELDGAGLEHLIVGPHRPAGRLQVGPGALRVHFRQSRVSVSPLPAHQRRTFARPEVDGRIRTAVDGAPERILGVRRPSDGADQAEDQRDKAGMPVHFNSPAVALTT